MSCKGTRDSGACTMTVIATITSRRGAYELCEWHAERHCDGCGKIDVEILYVASTSASGRAFRLCRKCSRKRMLAPALATSTGPRLIADKRAHPEYEAGAARLGMLLSRERAAASERRVVAALHRGDPEHQRGRDRIRAARRRATEVREAFAWEGRVNICAECGAHDATYETLFSGKLLCKRCYAEKVIVRNDGRVLRCRDCNGKGKTTCDDCHGEGERECDMGHEHECNVCNGDGLAPCQTCNGIGRVREQVAA